MKRPAFFIFLPIAILSTLTTFLSAETKWEKSEDGVQQLLIDTEKLRGAFVARDERDLKKGFARHGLRGLVFKPTNADVHAPEGAVGAKRRHQGHLNLYRVYAGTETLGSLRDDLAKAEELENGARLTWAATANRPFEVIATWRLTGPAQIDLDIVAIPTRDLSNFEILPASYCPVEMVKSVYLMGSDGPEPKIVKTPADPEQAKLYPFYPMGEAERDAQLRSGRTESEWKWPTSIEDKNASLPIVFANDEKTEIILMGDPKSVSAVCATPRPDSGDPTEWNSVGQHSALYLSLFGRDVKAGEKLTARARLVFRERTENSTQEHLQIYEEFVNQPEKELPFPANRLRNFYRNQALHFLDSNEQLPAILPQFPGLDGGSWGHWGQNPESDNTDHRLNEVEFGGLLAQVTNFKGGTATKGVNVRVGDHTMLFDPERLTFVAAWEGDLVIWGSRRYGITSGVQAAGPPIRDLSKSAWNIPDGLESRYLGFYRGPEHVVFAYQIGDATIYDSPQLIDGEPGHIIGVDGALPSGVELNSALPMITDLGAVMPRAAPGQAKWADQTVVTKGELGEGDGPFVIDTLTIPYRDANPFKTPMRIGGVDIFDEGKIAVCTLMGDVWIVDGVDENFEKLTWRRFASALHQPLGLVVSDGDIHVIGRDQLTRLHDLNSDGEADFYECVTNDFPTSKGNSFALTLHQDSNGAFYWFTRSNQFGMTKFVPGGKPEAIATGLRGTNGTGVSPDGSIVFAMPQEGTWQPASAIFEVGDGSYHGHFGPKPEFGNHGYEMPMCFLPRGIDNSSGDVLFLPEDDRLGPLSGRIIGTSFGYCQHYLVLREETGDGVQGGVVPLPGEFLSGAHRLRFNHGDGHIYVAGTDGWQSYAEEDGSLQRLRFTGRELHLPRSVETRENGLIIQFDTEIDSSSLKVSRIFAEQWNYLYSGAYGSSEYSVKNPGSQGHDPVEVKSVQLLKDKRSIFVEIPQLHPVMQFHLYFEAKTAAGEPFSTDLYYSIFHLGEPFTEFPGYKPVEKQPWNDFPKPGENPVDPRLLEQEKMGKIVDSEPGLSAIAKLRVETIAGLQFKPKQLRVKAGARVALTVENTDPSMPHNFVLTTPESLQRIGEGSMELAASPDGLAKHYVIDDEGVLAMSPILQSGANYIVYFKAPKEPGEYPYLCTFPGHWQITRGVLIVEGR